MLGLRLNYVYVVLVHVIHAGIKNLCKLCLNLIFLCSVVLPDFVCLPHCHSYAMQRAGYHGDCRVLCLRTYRHTKCEFCFLLIFIVCKQMYYQYVDDV